MKIKKIYLAGPITGVRDTAKLSGNGRSTTGDAGTRF